VDGHLLFHLPRRAIPRPELRGRPADGYPWRFFGGPLLPGREACDAALDARARTALEEFVLALSLSAILAAYGQDAGMTNVRREAVGSLERAATDRGAA
jgi:hypothetical protein